MDGLQSIPPSDRTQRRVSLSRAMSDAAASFMPRRRQGSHTQDRTHATLENTTAVKRTAGLDAWSFSLREQKPIGVSRGSARRSGVFGRRRVARRHMHTRDSQQTDGQSAPADNHRGFSGEVIA